MPASAVDQPARVTRFVQHVEKGVELVFSPLRVKCSHLPLSVLQDHSLCYSDCHFTHTEGNVSLTFDFSLLSFVGSLMNGPSFTSKGTKYFHQFNISLCGRQVGQNETRIWVFCVKAVPMLYARSLSVALFLLKGHFAECTDNVTDLSITDSQREKGEGASTIKTFICQSTIIPANGRGFHTALSSQSINLADTFLGQCMIAQWQRYITVMLTHFHMLLSVCYFIVCYIPSNMTPR